MKSDNNLAYIDPDFIRKFANILHNFIWILVKNSVATAILYQNNPQVRKMLLRLLYHCSWIYERVLGAMDDEYREAFRPKGV